MTQSPAQLCYFRNEKVTFTKTSGLLLGAVKKNRQKLISASLVTIPATTVVPSLLLFSKVALEAIASSRRTSLRRTKWLLMVPI